MDISKLPSKSSPIKLSSVYDYFAQMEGEVPESEAATVVVKRATEHDNITRADYAKDRRRSFVDTNNPDILVLSYEGENRRALAAKEVHLTLAEVHHLNDNGKPIFKFSPEKMTFDEFEEVWAGLPSIVSTAIWLAVLSFNPDWSDD